MSPPATPTSYSGEPALAPPPGEEPQFDNPPNNNAAAYTIVAFCIIIVTFCVVTRVIFKVSTKRKPHLGDYISVISLCFFITFLNIVFWFIRDIGDWVHQWDIHIEDLPLVLYISHIAILIYESSMGCAKVSILLDWLTIFSPSVVKRDWFWYTSWALMVVLCLHYVIVLLVVSLSCIPVEAIWYTDMQDTARCLNIDFIYIITAAINLASDIVMLILPQGKIWTLQMPREKKVHAALGFSMGIVACGTAAVRLSVGIRVYTDEDTVWYLGPLALTCAAEMTCSYLVLCLPGVPHVYGRNGWVREFFSSRKKRSNLVKLDSSSGADDDDQSPAADAAAAAGTAGTGTTPDFRHYYHVEDGLPLNSVSGGGPPGEDPTGSKEGILRTTWIHESYEAAPPGGIPNPVSSDPRW